tara:strand:- start:697 stop:1125 length:429 start_codon:yes stop_codon:yes gene_type:complete
MARRLFLLLTFIFLTSGCYSLSEDAYFPTEYQETYTRVVTCQQTGHPSGGYQETWVSPEALTADDVQEGTVIMKVQWDTDSNCTIGSEDMTTVMRRTADGQGHDGGNWEWQVIGGLGDLVDNNASSCTACHASCQGELCSHW